MNARRYNKNKPRVGLLPTKALRKLVEVYERGAHKYSLYELNGEVIRGADIPFEDKENYTLLEDGGNNWRKGMSFTKTYESATRHIWDWYEGRETDEDLGTMNLANAVWNLIALIEMAEMYPELDDRFYKEESKNKE